MRNSAMRVVNAR